MNKKLIVMALAVAFVVAAVPFVLHAAVQVNESIPFDTIQFIPCANGGAGETVELTGVLHVLVTETINANRISGYMLFSPQGVSGRGETTGALYHAVGMTGSKFEGSFVNGQSTNSFVNNFDIIGQGPGNNFREHEVIHLTFNADGTLTAYVDDFRATCN